SSGVPRDPSTPVTDEPCPAVNAWAASHRRRGPRHVAIAGIHRHSRPRSSRRSACKEQHGGVPCECTELLEVAPLLSTLQPPPPLPAPPPPQIPPPPPLSATPQMPRTRPGTGFRRPPPPHRPPRSRPPYPPPHIAVGFRRSKGDRLKVSPPPPLK